MTHLTRRPIVPLAVAGLLVLAGCGTSPDDPVADEPYGSRTSPAGSTSDSEATTPADADELDAAPVTLRMAHIDGGPEGDPAATWFAERVADVSEGAVTVELALGCCGAAPDVERVLVEGVAAGDFELGWVGSRAFAPLGVDAFEPLVAPLVLDSYALQQAVIESDIARDVLAELDSVGVQGLALGPGPIRRPYSAESALVRPDDWTGVTVHLFPSQVGSRAITALGGTPTQVGFDERDTGLADGSIEGLENALGLHGNFVDFLPYGAVNVNLWPRVSVLIGHPETVAGLSPQQLGWIEQATQDVAARTGELAELDQAQLTDICANAEVYYTLAGEADLSALEEAFTPVYAELAQDRESAELLDRIRDLEGTVTPEPDLVIPEDCGAMAGAGAADYDGPTIPLGTYVKTMTRAEMVATGADEEAVDVTLEGGSESLRVTLDIGEDSWRLFVSVDGSPDGLGDHGWYHYDEDGAWVTVSSSGGCRGCTLPIRWTVTDDALTLDIDWDSPQRVGDDSDLDRAISSLVVNGAYERQ